MGQQGDEVARLERRRPRMERAVKAWKDQLVDLGGRNTLLYYKDLKQGTLDLGSESVEPHAVQQLLAGSTVRLSNLFSQPHLTAASKRARTVAAKAEENLEERGLSTLYVAWGMATWVSHTSAATPASPVLLCELALASQGRAHEDYDLTLVGEWELNPTLAHLLKTDYGVGLDVDALVELLRVDGQRIPDPSPLFERLTKEARDVEGFGINDRVVVGNFSYAKLPMVRDLDAVLESGHLLQHDLLAAIAGDPEASEAVRDRHPEVSQDEPDLLPPELEHLVLDADSSQSYVINAVCRGGDLVIEGPPGTGKSQTIANLIASLSAQGKSVLFVAEKRAAIDAVLERLSARGLGDVVLDLHDGVGSRRKVAEDLARALNASQSIALPDHSELHGRLARRRKALREWNEALHARRSPWNLRLYDVQAENLEPPDGAASAPKLPRDVVQALGEAEFREAAVALEQFCEYGGFPLASAVSPWSATFQARSVTTPAQVETARGLLDDLNIAISGLRTSAAAVAQAAGCSSPGDGDSTKELLQTLTDTSELLDRYDAAIFTEADTLAESLAPARRGGGNRLLAGLTDSTYRTARRRMTELAGGRKQAASAQARDAELAKEVAEAWQRLSPSAPQPRAVECASLATDLDRFESALERCRSTLGFDDLGAHTFDDVTREVDQLLSSHATLVRLPDLDKLAQQLNKQGVWPVVAHAAIHGLDSRRAAQLLRAVWVQGIVDCITVTDPVVGAFSGEAHAMAVAEFQQADSEHIGLTHLRVMRAVAERSIAARTEHPDQAKLIQREANKKQRHIPIRTLVRDAPDVLTAIKPCWAMSPLIVAQVLPPERLFDVVVFDEASQVMPADAVGSLLRADRAVVAGDSKQLPPTSFFATSSGGGEDDEDLEYEEEATGGIELTSDMESILNVMRTLLPPPLGTKTLEWHYRSQDERLITFSNAQASLYDWSLTTFPGAGVDEPLRHELIPWVPGRVGQEHSVSDEVERVVELVIEHAERRPGESLGIIAMGIKHAHRIEEVLRRVRIERPELDELLSNGPDGLARPEPLFIKNLERVQGDERDAIILTIGYGKNADGRMMYRFGPLNQEGGERRLNVAITRARRRMTVVSSFSSTDLDPNRMRAEGAQMLYRYLQYVESAGAQLGDQARPRPELNPFERDVRDALVSAGIPLVPQFGTSGYWIDFAAQHPERPGQMVLAIEADGATYHSSATARDRDRLRQEHLERLGWRFHRIWSTDWFRRRDQEIERTVEAWRRAVAASDVPDRTPREAVSASRPQEAVASAPQRVGARPRFTPGNPIGEYSPRLLRELASWIESDTLLRTEDQMIREMMAELGFKRKGKNVEAALTRAIEESRSAR